MKVLNSILILSLSLFALAQSDPANTPVPYTLEDRDRIMRTEFKIEKLETEHKAIHEKIETEHKAIRSEINGLRNNVEFLQTLILAVLTLIIGQFLHTIYINYNRKNSHSDKISVQLSQLTQRMEKIETNLSSISKKEAFDEIT